jgi:hypothetical protein
VGITFLADWLAKKSIQDFSKTEKMLRASETQLSHMSDQDPDKAAILIEQALVSCLLIDQLETCASLFPEEDQNELSKISLLVIKTTQDLKKKYPVMFDLIATTIIGETERQRILARFSEK